MLPHRQPTLEDNNTYDPYSNPRPLPTIPPQQQMRSLTTPQRTQLQASPSQRALLNHSPDNSHYNEYHPPTDLDSHPPSRMVSYASTSTSTNRLSSPTSPSYPQPVLARNPSSHLTFPESQIRPAPLRHAHSDVLSEEEGEGGRDKFAGGAGGEGGELGYSSAGPGVGRKGSGTKGGRFGLGRGMMRNEQGEVVRRTWGSYFTKPNPIKLFLTLVIIEFLVDMAIEAVLLYRFNQAVSSTNATWLTTENSRTLPVYLCIFGLAHLFQLVLAVDATMNRNTIQIIGLAVFNAFFLGYAVIQISEIKTTLGRIPPEEQVTVDAADVLFRVPVAVLTGAILGMISLAEVGFIVLSWFIWKEFGYLTYKDLGASLDIKRYHRHYQIFICIVRFSAFFFAGFSIQLIFLVLQDTDVEYYITIAALPVSVLLLVGGTLAARYEWFWAMLVFMFGLMAGCGYFVFKTWRIWQERTTTYLQVFKSLTAFSILSILVLILTFIWAIIISRNFGEGLKTQLDRTRRRKKSMKKQKHAAGGAERGMGTGAMGEGEMEMEKRGNRMSID